MTASSEAVSTMPASNVSFADDKISRRKSSHVIAGKIDNPNKFMPDGHRHGNRLLRPRVPVIYMNVSPADRRFDHANEHIVASDSRNGDFFQPKTGLAFAFHDGLHCFLHDKKVGESAKQESWKRFGESRLSILRASPSFEMMRVHACNARASRNETDRH